MSQPSLYPLLFGPIYQYRPWGGRRFENLLSTPLPPEKSIGEAWVLSDRDDHPSIVSNGDLQGQTIGALIKQSPTDMLGKLAGKFDRFPLLLKFLDAQQLLSVQVHPSDSQTAYLPPGEHGKTEAWVVLESSPEGKIFAGLNPGTTADDIHNELAAGTLADKLPYFQPKVGDGVFIKAGTVHAMGGLVVFEVQENSDVTFRLFDWNRVDPELGRPRDLQVAQALACIDFTQGILGPVTPTIESDTPVPKERLFQCEYFELWRLSGDAAFIVGASEEPRIIVCADGEAEIDHDGATYPLKKGDVMLLPAVVGACFLRPTGATTVFEIAIPLEA